MLIFAHDASESAMLEDWAAQRIPHMEGGYFGPCLAAGVVRDGRLRAVVIYHEWQDTYGTMQVSIASDGPGWATRGVLRAMFAYPFLTAGVNLLWSVMPTDNEAALEFNRRLGFKREAVLRHRFGPRRHAVVTSMTRGEYARSRWSMLDGKESTKASAAA